MPLRVRLTLWTACAVVGTIFLLGALTYALVNRSVSDEIDESLRTQGRNLSSLYQVRAALPPRTRERVIPQPSVFSTPAFHVQVLDPDGGVVERSAGLGTRRLPVGAESLRRASEDEQVLETVTLEGQDVRLLTMPLATEDSFLGFVQVARSLEALEDVLAALRRTLLLAGAGLLVISMAVAWVLAGLSLRPIGRVTQGAQEIALSGRLDRRLPPLGSRDEVARLVDTFNRMMGRLEAAFAAQRRFVGDASHELRTPLTTIRGNLEVLRWSGAVQPGDMQDALDDVVAEAERMSRLVDGLLALARADAGTELTRAPVQLDELMRGIQREVQPLAGQVAVRLGQIEPAEVVGDADALHQLLLILVDNGLKYTPPGGSVALDLRFEAGEAVARVSDTGLGIAEEDLPHIFERFYRSPTARSMAGTGLGLAIASWVAAEHGGRIEVASSPGQGSTFTVRLPATQPASRPADQPPVPEPELAPAR